MATFSSDSPLNLSVSKQLYSFPKARRFQTLLTSP